RGRRHRSTLRPLPGSKDGVRGFWKKKKARSDNAASVQSRLSPSESFQSPAESARIRGQTQTRPTEEKMEDQQLELDFSTKRTPASGQEALTALLTRTYLKYLQSDSWRVRRKGIRGLADVASNAPAVVEALESLLADKDSRVREATGI